MQSLVFSALCVVCHASGVVPVAQIQGPPQVVASSSQYFERTFNRLVAAPPPVLEAPVIPVAPAPVFAPAPPVFIQRPPVFVPAPPVPDVQPVTRTTSSPTNPTPAATDSNVAIAIATAHAAAPVATILLPPYPFGLPQGFGFIPTANFIPNEEPKERDPEPTTSTPNTTQRQPENTTPLSNNSENFGQGLPTNENVQFKQYAPPAKPVKPVKLRTSVEVVPVPLQYIAPPPIRSQPIQHIHTFIPTRARIVIRPVKKIRIPVRIVKYRTPSAIKNAAPRFPQNHLRRVLIKDVEPTTLRPFNKPFTKPPRQYHE